MRIQTVVRITFAKTLPKQPRVRAVVTSFVSVSDYYFTIKNNADKKERRFGVILTPFLSSKCLLIKYFLTVYQQAFWTWKWRQADDTETSFFFFLALFFTCFCIAEPLLIILLFTSIELNISENLSNFPHFLLVVFVVVVVVVFFLSISLLQIFYIPQSALRTSSLFQPNRKKLFSGRPHRSVALTTSYY